jgi:hypothetical protein
MYSVQKGKQGQYKIFQNNKPIIELVDRQDLTTKQLVLISYLMNIALKDGVLIGQMDQSLSREIIETDFFKEFKLNVDALE